MKDKPQPRRRARVSERTTSKVPLTYYRSSEPTSKESSPFRKKEEDSSDARVFFTRLIDGIIILALLAVLGYSLLVKADPKVALNSTTYHSRSVYKDAAQRYLSSLNNRNKITLNAQAVVKSMQKQFPEIATADVELPIFAQTPVIHLNIANPAFILSNNSKSYVVDSQGVAVGESSTYPAIKNLTTIADQSGFAAKSGQQVMSAGSVKFINTVVAQLKHSRVPIASLTLPPKAQELDLRTSDEPYFVKFYLGGDPLQQTGQLLASRNNFKTSNIKPAQYLDVRVPGKVFYK